MNLKFRIQKFHCLFAQPMCTYKLMNNKTIYIVILEIHRERFIAIVLSDTKDLKRVWKNIANFQTTNIGAVNAKNVFMEYIIFLKEFCSPLCTLTTRYTSTILYIKVYLYINIKNVFYGRRFHIRNS